MNCRGDDGIDAKRSRPSIGNTRYKCHARLERVLLVGTRSADYIRASGHDGCTATEVILQAEQAVYMAAPDPLVEMSDSSCTAGAVHTWHIASLRGGAATRSLSE